MHVYSLSSPNINSHLVIGPRYEVFFPLDGGDRAIATMEFHGLVAHRPATLLNHHQLNTQKCMSCVGGKKRERKTFTLCQFGKQRGRRVLMDLDGTSFLELETRAFAN